MRGKGTLFLLLGALLVSMLSVFGGDNFSRLSALENSLSGQREKTHTLEDYVNSLSREVHGLRSDDRMLEKAARNELGMARPGEIIVFFDDRGSNGSPADDSGANKGAVNDQ